MLSRYESRLSTIRLSRATQFDHVENCNSIHCDIIASVISKCDQLEENGIGMRAAFVNDIRSFVAERPSRRLALIECLSSSYVQQALNDRWYEYESDGSKSTVDIWEEYCRLTHNQSDKYTFPETMRGAAKPLSWEANHHRTRSKPPPVCSVLYMMRMSLLPY